ncbi:MAG: biotin--[acetyl-CoA-carboxylase] ligase [Desulfatibacillaceae bacterium]|nr:biotin--[acetyl-CoA-carboxylase] ligase [Desulfatibacillaceae bacterium]
MKSAILTMLRSSKGTVSGPFMAKTLGVSRVAVFKHIKVLKESGYEIDSGPGGYFLKSWGDFVYPFEFADRQKNIHYFESLESTMDEAREMARQGCPPNTVVIAGQQTRGRGRLSRKWLSNAGGLYFTLVLRPSLPVALAHRALFAASVCLCKVLRDLTGVAAMVKWPNDILVDEKKLVGILSEMAGEGDLVSHLNLGVGINVNNSPHAFEPKSVSIKELLGKPFPRRLILEAFLDKMDDCDPVARNIIDDWRELSCTLGRRVIIQTPRQQIEGIARDVDTDGALLVERADKTVERVTYGDCLHQIMEPQQ